MAISVGPEPKLVASKVKRSGLVALTFLMEFKPRQYLTVVCRVDHVDYSRQRGYVANTETRFKTPKKLRTFASGQVVLSVQKATVSNRKGG